MTKLMEQWIAKASSLPDQTQDALAQRLLREWDDLRLPAWQQELLDERLAEAERNPDDFITLDELKAELAQRRHG